MARASGLLPSVFGPFYNGKVRPLLPKIHLESTDHTCFSCMASRICASVQVGKRELCVQGWAAGSQREVGAGQASESSAWIGMCPEIVKSLPPGNTAPHCRHFVDPF